MNDRVRALVGFYHDLVLKPAWPTHSEKLADWLGGHHLSFSAVTKPVNEGEKANDRQQHKKILEKHGRAIDFLVASRRRGWVQRRVFEKRRSGGFHRP